MTTLPYTRPDLADTDPPYAVFIGWQEDGRGARFPLYNVIGGELHEYTVGRETLEREGIVIRTETEAASE